MSAQTSPVSVLGKPQRRVDGPLKVTGKAQYASDHFFPGMLYAMPVSATIANGTLKKLDLSSADSMPGVVAVYHRGNIGLIYRGAPSDGFDGHLDETRPPFEDDTIRYYGQHIALVVAQTFEQAVAAASVVKATYEPATPDVRADLEASAEEKVDSERGKFDQAWGQAAHKVDQVYSTPVETHNPIELHSTVASWEGNKLLVHESTQAISSCRTALSNAFQIPPENIEVVSRFLGSGFGGKLWPWTHCFLAVAASRNLKRPVKLVVSRRNMFESVGHRPRTQQHLQLAASSDGRLTALSHRYVNHTSQSDDYKENCGEATDFLYSVPNLRVASGLVRRHVGAPTSMRGPGAVPGLYAMESAMNELAERLKIDPVELRLRNEPQQDEGKKLPFSSRHLTECLQTGAHKFGWSKRNPAVGSMREGGMILGWGMAACTWIAERLPCEATVSLHADGTARVACGTQDIGTGTYTILAQIVSELTSVPLEKVQVVLGSTTLPTGPLSGGSMATASVVPAVSEATRKAIESLLTTAKKADGSPLKTAAQKSELQFSQGYVHIKGQAPNSGVPFAGLLAKSKIGMVSGNGKSEGTMDAKPKFSLHSYGAHFVEIGWQPEIARLRVRRVVTVIDAGRILNLKAGRNQIEGAIMMGIGMGMFEQTKYDARSGAPLNSNLADYIVATHADTPAIDVTFLDYPDLTLNELGARGIGEIGLAGIAAALTDAVHHATGVRARHLPVEIENLLEPQSNIARA